MSIGVSFIICVVWTLIAPEKDKNAWARFKGIEVEDGEMVRMPGCCSALFTIHKR